MSDNKKFDVSAEWSSNAQINLDKYKDEFSSLSDEYGIYTPVRGFGSFMMGGGLNGLGKFGGIDSTAFQFDNKAGSDAGFKQKYIDGTLEVENAFVIGYTEHTNTNENGNYEKDYVAPGWTSWVESVVKSATFSTNVSGTYESETLDLSETLNKIRKYTD